MKWVLGMIDRLFVIAGVLLFSQFPLFVQQYTQQLSGHAAELHYQVKKIDAAAQESHKTLAEYILKFLSSSDPDFMKQGQMMQGMVDRLVYMQEAFNAINEASLTARPFLFLTHMNSEVVKATWQNFEFGFSFSSEGIAYALIGGAIGYSVFNLIVLISKWACRLLIFKKAPSSL